MKISLTDRVALVSGAAQGIGEGIALVLARAGADVVVCDINAEGGQATADAIAELGRRSLFVQADISDPDAVSAMMDRIGTEMGGLDILVNNAAIEYFGSIADTTVEQWDRTQAVDLKGIFLMTKFALPMLKASEHGGVVVNISSVHAVATIPDLGAYAAAKGGIVALTRSLAQDLGREGVRALCISPGFIDSPMTQEWAASTPDSTETWARVLAMHPMGCVGQPEDIGNFIAFACSDLGAYINGANIVIDGGLLTKLHH
jgi:NAD(P)-dependent dehydrogenase (short-subunit alcohol dehydrogenase family)